MHTLTKLQREQWQTDGYLHIEGALKPDQVELFTRQMDRIRGVPGFEPDSNPNLPIGHYAWLDHAKDLNVDGFMDRRDLLNYHQGFIDLIDHAPIFDYIVELMGVNILLSMTQAIARPVTEQFPGYTHTDGGESLRLTRVAESSPPIAMKAMYLLSDVHAENCGNLTVFPGSHLRQIPLSRERAMTPYAPGAVQLMGNAGDAYLFPHSLWHGPAQNLGAQCRKVLLYNYCQLWVRSYDHERVPSVVQQCSARQCRLLGDLGYDFRPGSYFYVPKDQAQVISG